MAIVSRIEFAGICEKSPQYISQYIKRNKISVLPNGQIDTENPLNLIFKKNLKKVEKKKVEAVRTEKREARAVPEVEELPTAELYKQVVQVFTKPETAYQKKQREKQNEEDKETVNWDARKKKADALKAERSAELAQLQVEKMMGNLMPVDLVEMILKVNVQDIFKTFENELINLGSIYCDILAGGNRDKLAEIVVKLRMKLSETIKRIELTAAQEIENVVEDYAETRNRGERK